VFVVAGGMRMVQGFTTDKAALTEAVGLAVQRAAMLITRSAQGERVDGGGSPPGIASAESGAGEFAASGRPAAMAAIAVPSVARNTWEMLERQFNGHSSTDGVLTATAALATLPGRKTLLYFTDGIAVPDDLLPRIHDVVATANRGQVTIYSIDTGGLRVGSQNAATAREVTAMGSAGLAINADGSSNSNLAMMEHNEEVLRRAPRVGLTLLAKPTGGFLIENTNDLAAGVRRIEEDRRVHYLLTYTPARTGLDGTWRTIDVKVKRRGVTVRARQGYVAVRSPGVLPVLVYEGPALAAIDRTPIPREIRTRVGAFAFPRVEPPEPGKPAVEDVAVVVTAPAAPLTFEVTGSSYRTDYTMLALLRDNDGQPIHKMSQPYRLIGPAGDRARAMGGEVRLARTLPMTPGAYRAWGRCTTRPAVGMASRNGPSRSKDGARPASASAA
jgi:VWFA-related protein